METLAYDLRSALRMFARNPGFALVAVAALALGIGANTAIFSIVDAVLLRPLPYDQPQQLVKVWGNFSGIGLPNDRNWISAPEFADLRGLSRSFAAIAAIDVDSFNLSSGGIPERVQGARVSQSFFPLLGVQPQFGRGFAVGEDQPGRDNIIVLSHELWQRRFGADRALVGRKITVNGAPFVVVGVLPPGFQYPAHAEVWTPIAFPPEALAPDRRGNHGLEVLARLKRGLSLEQARADMRAVTRGIIEQNPAYPYRQFHFAVILSPLLEETVGDVQKTLWVLMGAVGFVLLIACANVANLLLARAAVREREMAVRTAIGASRGRLVRQLLTESLLLSVAGAAIGLLIARWGLRALGALSATVVPRLGGVSIDGSVLAFTALLALATAVIFGLAPALQVSRTVTYESLKEGGRGASPGAAHHALRRALIVAEVALSLVLLVGAGLLIRSLLRVLNVDPGFRADRVLTVSLSLPEARYSSPAQVRAFYRELLDRVERLPGVEAAGGISSLPLSGSSSSGTVTIDTAAVPPDQTTPEADLRPITPDYFRAMGIRLLRGRFFDARDQEDAAPVAIVDETMANTYWPSEDPVGKRIKRGGKQSRNPWMTVVGVVKHVRYRTLEAQSRVQLYWPEPQSPWPFLSLAIRTGAEGSGLTATVQKQVLAIDPDQPIYAVRTMQQYVSQSIERRQLSTVLLAVFAGLALLLAAIGIYGVFSYLVTQRSHEIGIRIALGARRSQVWRLVLGQSLSLTVAGIATGLIFGLALTRLLASLLFEVNAADPYTFAAVALILAAVAVVASFMPARRATRVDPIEALRQE